MSSISLHANCRHVGDRMYRWLEALAAARKVVDVGETKRPRQVVIVDADNPMDEIHGEFFWREDHEQILEAARQSAYREGYDQGFKAGALRREPASVRVRLVRRRSLIFRAFVAFVALAYLAVLIGGFGR